MDRTQRDRGTRAVVTIRRLRARCQRRQDRLRRATRRAVQTTRARRKRHDERPQDHAELGLIDAAYRTLPEARLGGVNGDALADEVLRRRPVAGLVGLLAPGDQGRPGLMQADGLHRSASHCACDCVVPVPPTRRSSSQTGPIAAMLEALVAVLCRQLRQVSRRVADAHVAQLPFVRLDDYRDRSRTAARTARWCPVPSRRAVAQSLPPVAVRCAAAPRPRCFPLVNDSCPYGITFGAALQPLADSNSRITVASRYHGTSARVDLHHCACIHAWIQATLRVSHSVGMAGVSCMTRRECAARSSAVARIDPSQRTRLSWTQQSAFQVSPRLAASVAQQTSGTVPCSNAESFPVPTYARSSGHQHFCSCNGLALYACPADVVSLPA